MHANLQTEEQALGWLKGYENFLLICECLIFSLAKAMEQIFFFFFFFLICVFYIRAYYIIVLIYCHILGYLPYSQRIFR